MSLESRSNSQDSDYELMQQYSRVGTRIQRGHSVREQPPLDSQQAPQHKPPYPPRKSRISPNRWRNYHRLSSGRTKNCTGPQDLRRMEGDYAVPRIRSDTEAGGVYASPRMEAGGVYASPRISRETEGRRYDGFFRGSIAEEGEGEGGEGEEYERGTSSIGSMVVVPEKQQQCYCKMVLLGFVLVLLLSIALAGLGLALFNKITRNSHNSVPVSDTMCDSTTWCGVTVTMAAHTTNCTPCINSSTTCKTEPLLTNITVSIYHSEKPHKYNYYIYYYLL